MEEWNCILSKYWIKLWGYWYQTITFPLSIDADYGDHPDLVHGRGYGRSDRTGNVLVVVCSVQRQKRDRIVV